MDEEGPWRILEFYCGIGGLRYSLMRAGIRGEVLEAFDINDRANDVYQHNFGHRPFQGNVQTLTSVDLDKYRAHVWLMSPPCQPYTRQGLQKDSADARASSFIKIFELIPHMLKPPLMLFVENVVGFETSDTHKQLMEILSKADFATQEFILSPLQFGVPYSRPRYFCLAKREPTSFENPSFNNQLHRTPIPLLRHMNGHCDLNGGWRASEMPSEPIQNFLQTANIFSDQREIAKSHFSSDPEVSPLSEDTINYSSMTNSVHNEREDAAMKVDKSSFQAEENGDESNSLAKYLVPLTLIDRWGSAMDVVYPDSKRCCCFTKSYYRYVKGTGSFLAMIQPEKKSEASSLKELSLRYFTPREVANLHSFPEDFNFPEHISLRQRYALLGNSLSVAVVAPLLKYLIAETVVAE